jgi:hypothetical protein
MDYRPLCTLLIAFLVTACPGEESGVEHIAILDERPDLPCIWDRLLGIAKWPRIQTIRNETRSGVNHIFYFETDNALHAIGILIGDDGSFTYSSTAGATNHTLPELRAAQQSLFAVDKALDGQCNLSGLMENVRQTCFGKNCDQLATAEN